MLLGDFKYKMFDIQRFEETIIVLVNDKLGWFNVGLDGDKTFKVLFQIASDPWCSLNYALEWDVLTN